MTVIAIACGGRDLRWHCEHEVFLRTYHADHNIIYLLVGSNGQWRGRPRGADAYAYAWAERHGIDRLCRDANWEKYGKAAGPIRNGELLAVQEWLAERYRADRVVLALPGGRGTTDMCRQAEAAGVAVRRYEATQVIPEGMLL